MSSSFLQEIYSDRMYLMNAKSEIYMYMSVFIFCTVPSRPPTDAYAVVKSSTLMWLHWSPPPDIHMNGILTYYIIHVQEMYTGRNWTFHSIGTVLRLGSLHPHYNYSFSVLARTFGNGPSSQPSIATTLEDGK